MSRKAVRAPSMPHLGSNMMVHRLEIGIAPIQVKQYERESAVSAPRCYTECHNTKGIDDTGRLCGAH